MDNGNNYDLFILNPKVNPKRKPPNQGAAGASVNHRIQGWIFRYRFAKTQHLVEKFVPETLTLLLIPGGDLFDIRFRLWPNIYPKTHNRFFRATTTSPTSRPLMLSAS